MKDRTCLRCGKSFEIKSRKTRKKYCNIYCGMLDRKHQKCERRNKEIDTWSERITKEVNSEML